MNHFPLLDLPREIRDRIYEYALAVEAVTLDLRRVDRRPRMCAPRKDRNLLRHLLAVTTTSRQVRLESMRFFWSNHIKLQVWTEAHLAYQQSEMNKVTDKLTDWVRSLGRKQSQLLNRLELILIDLDTTTDLDRAETCLVCLQHQFNEHLRLSARLSLFVFWTHSCWDGAGTADENFMTINFSAASRNAMLTRLGRAIAAKRARLDEIVLDDEDDTLCYERDDLKEAYIMLRELVRSLDENPQWSWTAEERA